MTKKAVSHKDTFLDIRTKDSNVISNVSDLKISCYNRKGSKDIDKERKPLNLLFASVHANEKFNRSHPDHIFPHVP